MSSSPAETHPEEGRQSLIPVNDFEHLIALLKQATAAAYTQDRWALAGRLADAIYALTEDQAERDALEIALASAHVRLDQPWRRTAWMEARTAGDTPAGEQPYPGVADYRQPLTEFERQAGVIQPDPRDVPPGY